MSDTAAEVVDPGEDQSLEEVILAMDVVDTLRHRERLVSRELDAEGRENKLVERLREIYSAQGMTVPDAVLRDGVRALEERRFAYVPPEGGLQVWLAKRYVGRDRWLRPVGLVLLAVLAAWLAYRFAYIGPKRAEARRIAIELDQTIPAEANRLFAEIDALTDDSRLEDRARAFQSATLDAAADDNLATARRHLDGLQILRDDLAQTYEVRVVYGPDEPYSGIYRWDPELEGVRNYYLIVEAIGPAGEAVDVPLTSEEDPDQTGRQSKWAQRVPKRVFDAVSADKRDDGIIQGALVAQKASGTRDPEWRIDIAGGALLEW